RTRSSRNDKYERAIKCGVRAFLSMPCVPEAGRKISPKMRNVACLEIVIEEAPGRASEPCTFFQERFWTTVVCFIEAVSTVERNGYALHTHDASEVKSKTFQGWVPSRFDVEHHWSVLVKPEIANAQRIASQYDDGSARYPAHLRVDQCRRPTIGAR